MSGVRSSEPETACNDAAQDLTRAAAQRERRRRLRDVAEHLLQIRAAVQRRLEIEQRMRQLGNRLLEGRADVLYRGGLEIHRLAGLQHPRDRRRHLPQRRETRDHAPDRLGAAVVGMRAHLAHQLADQRDGREVALGSAALEAELGGDLLPAVALVTHTRVVGNECVGEVHLVEVMLAGEVDDRPDRDALGVAQIDEELREPLVLLVWYHFGSEQRDGVVGQVRVRSPHLGAVDEIAAVAPRRARANGRQVGARVRLAHADGERELAADDAGQDFLSLRFRSEPNQQRAALPIGHPVRAHGRARGQHLLHDDVTLEEGTLVAAILLRPCHPDPPARADAARELAVEPAPRARTPGGRGAEFFLEELADFGAETLGFGRQIVERESEDGRHGREWTTSRATTQRGAITSWLARIPAAEVAAESRLAAAACGWRRRRWGRTAPPTVGSPREPPRTPG